MREVPSIADIDRLQLAVRDELAVQHGIARRKADDHWLDTLAEMVVARIDNGFDFRWAPKWVRDGQPHAWTEEGEAYIECLKCNRITAHSTSEEARAWYVEHYRSSHGGDA